MRITQAAVERLADEAGRITGKTVLESISKPGDGTTHYVMAESMVSTYIGSRAAAAYLLGVLTGAHPEGQVHWIEHRPEWVTEIDDTFRFGSMPAPAVAAFHAGYQYGKSLRDEIAARRLQAGYDAARKSHGDSYADYLIETDREHAARGFTPKPWPLSLQGNDGD